MGRLQSRSRPISPDLPRSPPKSRGVHTSNARPARSGSSYGPIRPHRPLRHACRPARTAERHERRSNGPSAAATAEDRTDRTRSARMTGSPPKLPAPTRPPNSSRSCVRRTADKLSRSHQLTSPKDLPSVRNLRPRARHTHTHTQTKHASGARPRAKTNGSYWTVPTGKDPVPRSQKVSSVRVGALTGAVRRGLGEPVGGRPRWPSFGGRRGA